MKISLKFRDDEQSPLVRAKVPLTILSFPFQSAIAAGESKDLALSLSTSFDSGPSLKVSFRPKDSDKPFPLVFKAGVGRLGCPKQSPLVVSAELNVIGTENPSFLIRFKPDLGDFLLNKLYSSSRLGNNKAKGFAGEEARRHSHDGVFDVSSGFTPSLSLNRTRRRTYLGGLTTVSVRDFAVVNFRWGIRSPAEAEEADALLRRRRGETAAANGDGWTFGKGNRYRLPHLVMNKIRIEPPLKTKEVGPIRETDDVAGARLDVQKHNEEIKDHSGDARSD